MTLAEHTDKQIDTCRQIVSSFRPAQTHSSAQHRVLSFKAVKVRPQSHKSPPLNIVPESPKSCTQSSAHLITPSRHTYHLITLITLIIIISTPVQANKRGRECEPPHLLQTSLPKHIECLNFKPFNRLSAHFTLCTVHTLLIDNPTSTSLSTQSAHISPLPN